MTILVPILVAVVPTVAAALIGLVTYRNQKRTDRKVELKNRRMKEYERYLRAYSATLGWEGAEDSDDAKKATSEYWRAYSTQFQIASDPVLLAVTDFHKGVWKNDPPLDGESWRQRFRKQYATMILRMRKDAFEKSELEQELVEERLPFDLTEDQNADASSRTAG